jgi:hypothetical protein
MTRRFNYLLLVKIFFKDQMTMKMSLPPARYEFMIVMLKPNISSHTGIALLCDDQSFVHYEFSPQGQTMRIFFSGLSETSVGYDMKKAASYVDYRKLAGFSITVMCLLT